METIHVNASKPYDVILSAGVLSEAGKLIRTELEQRRGTAGMLRCRRVCVVTDETVGALYGGPSQALHTSLRNAGFETTSFVFPGGESHKTMDTVSQLLDHLTENRFSRTDLLVALGGGITGDVTGFAAAIYLRGIDFVQIPTTLLAAVDSSVGGKTGVNLPAGKNLAGAFWQPLLVLFDPAVMTTLSQPLLMDGMAEILKAGFIADSNIIYDAMNVSSIFDHPETMMRLIGNAVNVKRQIVEADERESGERMLLNLGHTVGHAIEKCSSYEISHGAAVAIGMKIIAKAGQAMEWIESGYGDDICGILDYFGYDLRCPYPAWALADAALNDKKMQGGRIRLVVPDHPGHCILKEVPAADLEDIIQKGL